MDGPKRKILVALSQKLEVTHQAYIKSLRGARFDVVSPAEADELIALAREGPALLVLGSATKLPGVTGLDLLARLDELSPKVTAPILLLQEPGKAPGPAPKTSLNVLQRWSQAREALGLSQTRSVPKTEPRIVHQPIRLKSTERTLDMVAGPKQGRQAAETAGDGGSPLQPLEAPIELTEADRVDAGDATEEIAPEPPAAAPPRIAPPEVAPIAPAAAGPAEAPPAGAQPAAEQTASAPTPVPPAPDDAAGTPDRTEEMTAPGFEGRASPVAAAAPPAPMPPMPPAPVGPVIAPAPATGRRLSPIVIAVVVVFALAALAAIAIISVTGFGGAPVEDPAVPAGTVPEARPVPPPDAAPPRAADAGGPDAAATVAGGDAAPATDAGPAAERGPEELPPSTEELVLPLKFRRNEVDPYTMTKREIRRIIDLVKDNPSAELVLTGHASSDEPPGMAEMLGTRRAKAARDLICLGGPSRKRFTVVSAGATQPVTDDQNNELLEDSRRVVLRITKVR